MDRVYVKDSQVFYLNKFVTGETNSEWTTTYEKSIQLERKMECALIDLKLPDKLYNFEIHNKNLSIDFIYDLQGLRNGGLNSMNPKLDDRPFNVKPFVETEIPTVSKTYNLKFHYENINELFDHISQVVNNEMNGQAKKEFNEWRPNSFPTVEQRRAILYFAPMKITFKQESKSNFSFTSRPGRISITSGWGGGRKVKEIARFVFNFSRDLHSILGIPEEKYPLNYINNDTKLIVFNEEKIHIKRYKNLLKEKILFVYCDILKQSFIDNRRGEVLRVVTFSPNNNNLSFKSKIFIPLRMIEIDTIKISIRDYNGNLFYYKDGYISLALIIRPIEMS